MYHYSINRHDTDTAIWKSSCLLWGRILISCTTSVLRNDRKYENIFVSLIQHKKGWYTKIAILPRHDMKVIFSKGFEKGINIFKMLNTNVIGKAKSTDLGKDLLYFNTRVWDSHINSVIKPNDAYVGHWTGSSLVPVMACVKRDTELSTEPMLIYWEMDLQ